MSDVTNNELCMFGCGKYHSDNDWWITKNGTPIRNCFNSVSALCDDDEIRRFLGLRPKSKGVSSES